ncbi:Methyltransf-11 domain-containing protein [Aphelenchoides besseyi]|nr:Methyltransf-11 domain-containing protein [Aphelenchoides besseyi]
MKLLHVLSSIIEKLIDWTSRLYFHLFDRYVLYPLMRTIGKKYEIEFLNLGYIPAETDFTLLDRNLPINRALRAHYQLYEKALSTCPLYPDLSLKLLDVGCGLGGGIREMKIVHPELLSAIGVDKCIRSHEETNLFYGDAEELPFADGSFDLVVNVESSHLYANPQSFFTETHRVLRTGGYLCWADLRAVEKALEPFSHAKCAGLKLVRYEKITEQVLAGIHVTAAHYDSKLKQTPFIIRFFSNTLRTTYCAPGTRTYENFNRGLKDYYVACWQKT